ncbi:MAG TPA: hypothetical protein VH519_05530 [Hyphomicrobiaceae bacterium]
MAETESLETKRSRAEAKLAALRMAPPAAELIRQADDAARKYKAEADALQAEVDQVDREMGVREMDRRAASARQKEEAWLADRAALLAEEDLRLADIDAMEAAWRTFVARANSVTARMAREAELARRLSTSGKVPSAVNIHEFRTRTSGRVACLGQTIDGCRARFGGIAWVGAALYKPNESWRAAEEARFARDLIEPLLERGRAD